MPIDPSDVILLLDGKDATPITVVGSLNIADDLNDAPNSATLTTHARPIGTLTSGPFWAGGFYPVAFNTASAAFVAPTIHVGQKIQIYLGQIDPAYPYLQFGGEVTVAEQFATLDMPLATHVGYHLSCIDFTRRANRRKVLRSYPAQSATAIVLDLVARYTDLTAIHVAPALPTIDGGIDFTWEELSRALSRIAEKIGADWYWDYTGDLHFALDEVLPDPDPLVFGAGARFADLTIATDITQVRTRVLVEGNGSTVLRDLPVTETILPIRETTYFEPAGGLALVGTQRIPYTGLVPGDVKVNTVGDPGSTAPPPTAPAPPGAPTAAIAAGAVGNLAGGPYRYAVTLELADGSRSDPSAVSNPVTIAAAGVGMTAAAATSPKAPGPIRVGQDAVYGTTYVDAAGRETDLGPNNGLFIRGAIVDPPASGTIAGVNVSGSMVNGYYYYRTSFLTPGGETTPADNAWGHTGGFGGIRVTVLGTTDTRVVGRRIYRSTVSATNVIVLPWRVLVDVPGSTQTTYDDITPDASLSTAALPAFNSATDVGEAAIVTVPTSSDPRVTRRRIYRNDGPAAGAAYRLVDELPNNTTTTYLDNRTGGTGAIAPSVNAINTGAVDVTGIGLGPATTVRRRVFRTTAGGSALREVTTIENNTATTVRDAEADATLGGAPLPAQGGPFAAPTIPPTPIGSPTIRVSTLAGLPAAGWILVDDQFIRYTGTSPADSLLTGIPTTGAGAITAAIAAGAVITAAPALTGATLTAPIAGGDEIQLLVQVDDTAAQTAIATLEGGDGVIEEYLQDRRLSAAGARARALASLAVFKAVEVRITYTTYDEKTRSGRTVHVDLGAPTNLHGDFLIQSVAIDQVSIAAHTMPRRRVTASSARFTFEHVLQRLLMEEY